MKRKVDKTIVEIELDLIGHMGILANTAVKSKGLIETIEFPEESLERVKGFLGVPDLHCILFSIILRLSFNDDEVSINNISNYLECSDLAVIRYIRDIKLLEEKKLVRKCFDESLPFKRYHTSLSHHSYQITRTVFEALLDEDRQMLHPEKKVDMISFLENIHALISRRDDDEISYSELIEEMNVLIQTNPDVPFIRNIENLSLCDDDKILLIFLCRETLNGEQTSDLVRACDMIYPDPGLRFRIRKEIIKGNNELVSKNFIKTEEGIFRTDRDIKLTDKALIALFKEDVDVVTTIKKNKNSLLSPSVITPADLFFNDKEMNSLVELKSLLTPQRFKNIRRNLKNKGMPSGITVLFHGSPGTGKTAFAYQLARATGRSIMMVDISDTKSMWFGESEKKIKKVFMDYCDILKTEKTEPILLFNECDAIFSTRKKIGNSAIDQTENNIQNIILQEMENFQGVLIATTNLTDNLDPAFERRFLYKVLFNKPDCETRKRIWMNKIIYLTPIEVHQLATKYTFSGGNIENVCRKIMMKEILYSKKPEYNDILALCSEELLHPDHQHQIGFRL